MLKATICTTPEVSPPDRSERRQRAARVQRGADRRGVGVRENSRGNTASMTRWAPIASAASSSISSCITIRIASRVRSTPSPARRAARSSETAESSRAIGVAFDRNSRVGGPNGDRSFRHLTVDVRQIGGIALRNAERRGSPKVRRVGRPMFGSGATWHRCFLPDYGATRFAVGGGFSSGFHA
jgi:hypothetical protein